MRWIIEIIIAHRNISSLLLTVSLSLAMISAGPEAQSKVIRYLNFSLYYPAFATVSQITRFGNVYSENTRLKHELAQTNARLHQIEDQSIENRRLRGLLGVIEDSPYELVPVRVVAYDPSHLSKSIVVSGGKNHDIVPFMPLVAEHGAVGKVIQVMSNISLVQLLRDPFSRTSVMCRRTRAVGIMETENSRDFFIRMRSHEDVHTADTIVTAGLGGIYPKGLLVGTVSKISDDKNSLFKRVYINFTVDFGKLEELFVIRLAPQWSAFRDELDSLKIKHDK
ncbi:MAG: rod shape-determining protein MreC [Chitinispirillales bacterium]|jgi:rod shape-determining protein MreC|nr:rod shape-determining protein MreC [Chitinispirillales bacterium]